jgi:hypothetical protein
MSTQIHKAQRLSHIGRPDTFRLRDRRPNVTEQRGALLRKMTRRRPRFHAGIIQLKGFKNRMNCGASRIRYLVPVRQRPRAGII